jgi:hypothetical protein
VKNVAYIDSCLTDGAAAETPTTMISTRFRQKHKPPYQDDKNWNFTNDHEQKVLIPSDLRNVILGIHLFNLKSMLPTSNI